MPGWAEVQWAFIQHGIGSGLAFDPPADRGQAQLALYRKTRRQSGWASKPAMQVETGSSGDGGGGPFPLDKRP